MTQPRVNNNWLGGYTHTLKPNLLNDFGSATTGSTSTRSIRSRSMGRQAGSSLGIPGFDGDVKYAPRAAEHQRQQLRRSRRRRHQLVSVRHDVPDVQRARVLGWRAQSPAGFDLRRLATGRRAANDPRGLFSFTNDITGYAMAAFMLGLPRTVIPPTDQIQGHVGGWRNGFFVNDVWQPSRNVTLSLGLRYELNTPVQTYEGLATMLAEDLETIIPALPVGGLRVPRAEQQGHRAAARRHLSPQREDRGARRLRDLLTRTR